MLRKWENDNWENVLITFRVKVKQISSKCETGLKYKYFRSNLPLQSKLETESQDQYNIFKFYLIKISS